MLPRIAGLLPCTSWVLDGHCGPSNAFQRARQANGPLMATRRCEAALDCPSTGPSAGRGPHRQDGRTVEYDNIPVHSLTETTVEGHLQTRLSQAQRLPKEFAPPLHGVLSAPTNLRTQAHAHVSLFSSDLALASASLIDSEKRRWHIECHFRDATQYWGLEDCMNVTPTGVTKAAHRSLFRVNVAHRLRADGHPCAPDDSVLDLKASCRGDNYVEETIQMLPEKPAPVFFATMLNQVAGSGRLHPSQPSFSLS